MSAVGDCYFKYYVSGNDITIRSGIRGRDEPGVAYDNLRKLFNHMHDVAALDGVKREIEHVGPTIRIYSVINPGEIISILKTIEAKNKFKILKGLRTMKCASPSAFHRVWTIPNNRERVLDPLRFNPKFYETINS